MITEVITEHLQEHKAVLAWRQLHSKPSEPDCIEVLKRKRKSCVYRLRGIGPDGTAVIAKRCLEATAQIERLIYEELLPHLPVPALCCYGLLKEPEAGFCWLFLEDAAGELYSPQRSQHRELAGRWLGEVHGSHMPANLTARLPDRGTDYYLELLRSTRAALLERVDNPVLSADEVRLLRTITMQCDSMEAHWKELEKLYQGRRRMLVHDDFVIKNLRIRTNAGSPALLVFDWEMAGWGLPASDMAQFVGHCVSPDLDVYYSVLRRSFPELDVQEIRRLAEYGNLLRMVDKMSWAALSMVGNSYECLVNPLSHLKTYESQLAATLHAVHWGEHD